MNSGAVVNSLIERHNDKLTEKVTGFIHLFLGKI